MRWSMSSVAASAANGCRELSVTAAGSPSPSVQAVEQHVVQRREYRTARRGIQVAQYEHRELSVQPAVGGQVGERPRLRDPVRLVLGLPLQASDEHAQRTRRVLHRRHQGDCRPAGRRWELDGTAAVIGQRARSPPPMSTSA
jgi:hypothetical protein